MSRRELLILLLVLTAALFLRIYFVSAPGYQQEVLNYKIWSQASVQYGAHNIYDKTWCNIPPVNIYVLKSVGYVYRVFSPGYDRDTYLLQLLVKFSPILADIFISLIIFFYIRKKNSFKTSLLAMSAYAFNPAVIISSAYWGQMDPVALLFALGAVLALVNDKYVWAWSLMAIGLLANIHLAVLLPIFILITWKKKDMREVLRGLAISWGVCVVFLFQFLRFHQIEKLFDRVFYTNITYPYVSFVAFNFWWLFRGGSGNWGLDTDLFLNTVTYKTLGIVLLAVILLLSVRYLYHRYKDEHAIFLSAFVATFFYFMISTQMHERNIMPALIFLLLAAVNVQKLRPVFVIVSLTAFMNTLIALFWAYPKDFPVLPAYFQLIPTDMIICFMNIGVLFYVLYVITRDIRSKYFVYTAVAAILVLLGMTFIKPAHPIYLGDIAPKIKYQQSGEMQIDKSVEGAPMSVNGFKFDKGIGTRAYSSFEYELNGRYCYLEGMVGMDDSGAYGKKIEAWIYADNKLVYKSGFMRSWTDPLYFYIDIKGTKVIKLIISDGGDGNDGDNGDWLNIRVLP